MELAGKTALVTGGGARVGKAITLALADRGMQVAITYRTSAAYANETALALTQAGRHALAVHCDQRDPASIQGAIARIERELGPIAVLVNSAATFRKTPFEEATLEDWDEHLETNLRGPWLFARGIGPGMKARGEGAIINMVDIAAERPFIGFLPYSISKAGLAAMTQGLARVLAPEVRVNGIAPGAVLWPPDYPEAEKSVFLEKTPLHRSGSPDDITRAVLYLLDADYVTGEILTVDGGRSLV